MERVLAPGMGALGVVGLVVVAAGVLVRLGRVPQIPRREVGIVIAMVGVILVLFELDRAGGQRSRLNLASTSASAGAGTVDLSLNCIGGDRACRGRVTVSRGSAMLARGRVTLDDGSTETVALTRRGRRALRRGRVLGVVRLDERALGSVRIAR